MKFKLIALCPLLSAICISASAQGTAFTYQDRLNNNGAPANGLYDIRAGLYASSSGGALISALYTNSAVGVSNGLFTITLDFGDYAYPLDAGRWIFRGIELLLNGLSVRISSQPASNG